MSLIKTYTPLDLPAQQEIDEVVSFLFTQLEEFGYPAPDITKALHYALRLNGQTPGGLVITAHSGSILTGTVVYHSRPFEKMHNDVFKLYAEIIELNEKPAIPMGELGQNLIGHTVYFEDIAPNSLSYRAIVDIGLLDVEEGHIKPVSGDMQIVGASSDMIVVDIGDNPFQLKVGSPIEFEMDYMGLLRIMNSDYVDKRFEEHPSSNLKKNFFCSADKASAN